MLRFLWPLMCSSTLIPLLGRVQGWSSPGGLRRREPVIIPALSAGPHLAPNAGASVRVPAPGSPHPVLLEGH
jgi:hypothetical protein